MSVKSRWLFILVGNNATGKTTIQAHLVEILTGRTYRRLSSNIAHWISHPYIMRKFRRLFVAGRSYQELLNQRRARPYTSLPEYFGTLDAAAPDVDLAFMASHLDPAVIGQMIAEAHRHFWNVCGVFLSNAIATQPALCADISVLGWDERWVVENPITNQVETRSRQGAGASKE